MRVEERAVTVLWMCLSAATATAQHEPTLDDQLSAILKRAAFTGAVEQTLLYRLRRPLDPRLANLGRLLWFDKITGLHSDNTCGGCHSPTNGFGDTQSIAIGIQNNNVAGPNRAGPRNQRRAPSVGNAAFFSRLMWNGRFLSLSGNPFDNSQGFEFPPPEGRTKFAPFDRVNTHLLIAQAQLPPTELVEVAGFSGTAGTIGPEFDAFDDGKGATVPPPDGTGSRNEPIRLAGMERLNASAPYRTLFGEVFPEVRAGGRIDAGMFGHAIAEFEFTLTFANAPVDRFARGDRAAMSAPQKRGALIFFGKAKC